MQINFVFFNSSSIIDFILTNIVFMSIYRSSAKDFGYNIQTLKNFSKGFFTIDNSIMISITNYTQL